MLVSRRPRLYLNIVLMICSMLFDVSETHQTALVGTVYCDACFHQHFSESSYFISGASVAVECGGHRVTEIDRTPRFLKTVKTNKKGEFRVKLPFSATRNFNEIKGCSVKLISSNDVDCAVAASTTSSSIQLKTKTPEYHVFSAGFFKFHPLKQPKPCRMQSRNANSDDEFIAPTPLLSPVDDLTHINNLGSRFIPNEFSLQPPPDSMFNLDQPQPPPDSMIHLDPPQPPPDSMFNLDPPQPPPDSVIHLDPPQPPPDSMFNLDPPPPPASMLNPNLQPPPDFMFDLDPQPPPTSVFDPMPLPTPPAPIFDTFPPSPPSSTQLAPTPPSLPTPPPDPQPDLIQSTPPPPPPSMPPGTLLPPFPPFPFQPRQGLPRMPPPTSSANLKITSSP